MADKKSCWLPLEANPDVMNKQSFRKLVRVVWKACSWGTNSLNPYAAKLGMDMQYKFHDVFGLDSDLLEMLPQPCIALLLLFPINDKFREYEQQESERIRSEGQECSSDVFFVEQTIGNACGTIGMLHAIGNCQTQLKFGNGFLKTFFEKTKHMNPKERGKYLEEDEGISSAHEAIAQEGDTAPPDPKEDVNLHFIALIHKRGHIYELDGRKPFPINHGSTNADTFLADGAQICQEFMERDPSEMHFTVVALCKAVTDSSLL